MSDFPQPSEDARLLDAIAGGDRSAFELFVDRHKHRLFRYLCHRLADPHAAEDLLQEVFLRVFQRARQTAKKQDIQAWMFTVSQNLCTDHLRKTRRRREAIDQDRAFAGSERLDGQPLDAPLLAMESADRVAALLARLPAEQSQVVALRVFAELRFEQIARILQVPLPTVKSRMRYALSKLQEILEVSHER